MATDLKLNGGIEAGGDLNLGGAIATTGNITGNVVTAVGNVQGVDGVFSGDVSGTSGTFTGPVSGTTGTFTGAVSGASGAFTGAVAGPKAKLTAEGGLAVKLTNKTGAASIKGTIVGVDSAAGNAFDLTAIDANYNLGVVYESGVDDGAECWVVVIGIAEVLMKNDATLGQQCRIPLSTDTGEVAGYAMAAAQSATASVYKIGDILETKTADTLCKVLLH